MQAAHGEDKASSIWLWRTGGQSAFHLLHRLPGSKTRDPGDAFFHVKAQAGFEGRNLITSREV